VVLQFVNRDSGAEIGPVVVDKRTGQRLDLTRTSEHAPSDRRGAPVSGENSGRGLRLEREARSVLTMPGKGRV
jgi:hypothetical protein